MKINLIIIFLVLKVSSTSQSKSSSSFLLNHSSNSEDHDETKEEDSIPLLNELSKKKSEAKKLSSDLKKAASKKGRQIGGALLNFAFDHNESHKSKSHGSAKAQIIKFQEESLSHEEKKPSHAVVDTYAHSELEEKRPPLGVDTLFQKFEKTTLLKTDEEHKTPDITHYGDIIFGNEQKKKKKKKKKENNSYGYQRKNKKKKKFGEYRNDRKKNEDYSKYGQQDKKKRKKYHKYGTVDYGTINTAKIKHRYNKHSEENDEKEKYGTVCRFNIALMSVQNSKLN